MIFVQFKDNQFLWATGVGKLLLEKQHEEGSGGEDRWDHA
jgi:hypothetical protein